MKKLKLRLHIVTKVQSADATQAHELEKTIPDNSRKIIAWNDNYPV